jgi:hypothetical protein
MKKNLNKPYEKNFIEIEVLLRIHNFSMKIN